MIEGLVNADYEAVVTLSVRGPTGVERAVDAVVDTGFNSFLALPPEVVAELDLPFAMQGYAILADGQESPFDVYGATVLWDGQPRYVDTYVVDATPLVGMRMLDRQSLNVEVENGGRVVIQARS